MGRAGEGSCLSTSTRLFVYELLPGWFSRFIPWLFKRFNLPNLINFICISLEMKYLIPDNPVISPNPSQGGGWRRKMEITCCISFTCYPEVSPLGRFREVKSRDFKCDNISLLLHNRFNLSNLNNLICITLEMKYLIPDKPVTSPNPSQGGG